MSIYKRASGKWAVLVDDVRAGDNVRRRISKGTYPTKKEAEKAERDALSAKDRGISLSPETMTIAELYERFMLAHAHEHSITTIYGYKAAWKRCAPIAAIAVQKLQPIHLASLWAKLSASGRYDGKGLSRKSVVHTYGIVYAVLAWALDLEIITRNVAAVKAAKPVRPAKSKVKHYERGDAIKLIEAAAGMRHCAMIVFDFETALRRGELAGLKWTDVDLTRQSAVIRTSVAQVPGQKLLKPTKTNLVAPVALSQTPTCQDDLVPAPDER